jgi:hypothetical protein
MTDKPDFTGYIDPEVLGAVDTFDLDLIVLRAVKFLRDRARVDDEDPIVSLSAIVAGIGWPETQEMCMLLWLLYELQEHPNVQLLTDAGGGLEFRFASTEEVD